MTGLNEDKIRRANTELARLLHGLTPPEGLVMLGAAVASLIVSSWRPQEWDEIKQNHIKGVDLTLLKLGEVIEQKRRKHDG